MKRDRLFFRVIDVYGTKANMKRLMTEGGFTVRYVQRELGLECPQSVYQWLNPNRPALPSLDNLIMLAAVFGCRIEDILVTYEVERD